MQDFITPEFINKLITACMHACVCVCVIHSQKMMFNIIGIEWKQEIRGREFCF